MKIKVLSPNLNVRMGPDKKYPVCGIVNQSSVYTIIDRQNNFGLLLSRAGWIDLSFCEEIEDS